MMATALLLIASAVAGVFIGLLSGLLGVGGGMLMVPLFTAVFGMAAVSATATSLFAIIPTSVSGVATHTKNHTCIPAIGVAAGLGGALSSPLGVELAQLSPGWLIVVVTALIISSTCWTMLKKALALRSSRLAASADAPSMGALKGAVQGVFPNGSIASSDDDYSVSRKGVLQAWAIGLVAGVASGYAGVGGGFLMVPLFVGLVGMPMKKASGTSLIAVMILAIPGVVTQLLLGNVEVLIGIAVVCGTIPGAAMGARLIKRISEERLRFVFAFFLLFAALLMVFREFAAII